MPKNKNENTSTTEAETITSETQELMEFPLTTLAENVKQERFNKQAEDNVVNPIVLAELLGCRPQMIYNYIRKGKIASVKDNNTQKMTIEIHEAQRFANEYLTRKALKQIRIQEELAGTQAEELVEAIADHELVEAE